MHRLPALPALLTLGLAPGTAARAQTPPPPSDSVKAMTGGWEMSNAERDKTCVITFKLDGAGPGRALDLDKGCPGFPTIREAAAWTRGKDDALQLLDAKGKALLTFDEVESGLFE